MSFPLPVGPSGPVLDTDYENQDWRPLDNRPDWPKMLVGGKIFLHQGAHKYECVSVHDPDSEYDLPLTGLVASVVFCIESSDAWVKRSTEAHL